MNIVVVGPIPPPVDGRAQATQWLIGALRDDGHCVKVLNTHASAAAKAWRCVWAAAVFVCMPRPDCVIVVASGDTGLAIEAIPLLAARVRHIPSSLSHHSAMYIRSESTLFKLALAAGGPRLRHVVLDDAMGAELAAGYGVQTSRIVVVDNAGLMPLPPRPDPVSRRSGVVHLSNLSPSKGLLAVLDVAARIDVDVRLAGAISPIASSILEAAERRGVKFETLGPCFGDAKQRVLLEARCFLFLSSYRHEAQPLVLYEAVGAGCVPVVWQTGWVGEQMARLGLDDYVLAVDDIDGAARLVSLIVGMDDASFALLSARVRTAFESHHRRSSHEFRLAIR